MRLMQGSMPDEDACQKSIGASYEKIKDDSRKFHKHDKERKNESLEVDIFQMVKEEYSRMPTSLSKRKSTVSTIRSYLHHAHPVRQYHRPTQVGIIRFDQHSETKQTIRQLNGT